MNSVKPNLQQRIFWDVDFEKIDFDAKYRFVITRAFERGDVQDIREVRRYYGDEIVIEALTQEKYLMFDRFILAKNIFGLKDTDFKCFTLNQSKGIPWTF